MIDSFGRNITYMRISVTDLCNLRCLYCMPEAGIEKRPHRDIISVEEIGEIARAAAKCGIKKIRLTGGEPLVRRGIIDICRRISATEGIEELCITTNGILLPKYAEALKDAGVRRVNFSLDTLDAEKYRQLSRIGSLSDALAGLDAAKNVGFSPIKINAVLMGGVNDDEIRKFAELTRDGDIHVRYIELMPMGACAEWAERHYLPGTAVLDALPELEPAGTEGVTQRYRLPGYKGTVGIITPVSSHFCGECNRIRVTADGKLKTCLHSAPEHDLRGLSGEALEEALRAAILSKPWTHSLDGGAFSQTARNMNEIGG